MRPYNNNENRRALRSLKLFFPSHRFLFLIIAAKGHFRVAILYSPHPYVPFSYYPHESAEALLEHSCSDGSTNRPLLTTFAEEPARSYDLLITVGKIPSNNCRILTAADDTPRVEL